MFRKMPVILMITIILVLLFASVMPLSLKQFLYSVSLNLKEVIVFVLPFIIFCLLFKAAISLSKGALKVMGVILTFVCVSNFVSTFLSHYVGQLVHSFDLSLIIPKNSDGSLTGWAYSLPKLIPNDKAMFAGIISGIVLGRLCPAFSTNLAAKIDKYISWMLKAIVFAIPAFIAGFVVKLQHDNVINIIFKDYLLIFVSIALAQFSYIFLVYFLLNNGKVKAFLANIKNMLPAAISGFSTMSSAASMPLTIVGAEVGAKNKEVVRSVIPTTVNIHLVGDCFAIPIFAYAVLKSFGMPEPALYQYLIFAFYFVLAKFSVAAIPGGGIIVMLPILESHLGFNSEMMSLITALYVLFDPVITCANVLGNGAFAKMMDSFVSYINKCKSLKRFS